MRICNSDEKTHICKILQLLESMACSKGDPHFAKIHCSQQNQRYKKKLSMEYQNSLARKKHDIRSLAFTVIHPLQWFQL